MMPIKMAKFLNITPENTFLPQAKKEEKPRKEQLKMHNLRDKVSITEKQMAKII